MICWTVVHHAVAPVTRSVTHTAHLARHVTRRVVHHAVPHSGAATRTWTELVCKVVPAAVLSGGLLVPIPATSPPVQPAAGPVVVDPGPAAMTWTGPRLAGGLAWLEWDSEALKPDKAAWLWQADGLLWDALDTSGALPPLSHIDSIDVRSRPAPEPEAGLLLVFGAGVLIALQRMTAKRRSKPPGIHSGAWPDTMKGHSKNLPRLNGQRERDAARHHGGGLSRCHRGDYSGCGQPMSGR